MATKKDRTMKEIISALKKEFAPSRLFLFGSRSDGSHKANSDYDFLVVVKKIKGNRADNMVRASKALSHLQIQADVFVYSEKEFNEWKDELSSIPETALNTGKELPLGK